MGKKFSEHCWRFILDITGAECRNNDFFLIFGRKGCRRTSPGYGTVYAVAEDYLSRLSQKDSCSFVTGFFLRKRTGNSIISVLSLLISLSFAPAASGLEAGSRRSITSVASRVTRTAGPSAGLTGSWISAEKRKS